MQEYQDNASRREAEKKSVLSLKARLWISAVALMLVLLLLIPVFIEWYVKGR